MAAADEALAEAVRLASDSVQGMRLLRRLLARADREIARSRPLCLGGGCCCKFDLTGNLLYVSTLEMALLLKQAPPHPRAAARRRCPYQAGPRCAARDRRSLGCRIFFCQADPQWMNRLYERYHRLIRLLHERLGLEYRYVELTAALPLPEGGLP